MSVTITGTNDVPLVAATDVTGAVTELVTPTGNLTDSGTIAFTDVDLTDAHSISVTATSTTPLGTLTPTVSTDTTGTGLGGVITWNYSVPASAVEYLAKEQTKIETFTITLSDGNGGTVERTVSVTITGTNDVPVIGAGTFASGVTEVADLAVGENTTNLVVSNSFAVTDVDLTNTQSVAAVAAGAGYLGIFTSSVSDQTTTDGTGTIGWSFTVADSVVDYLAAGQTLTQTYTVTVTDTAGATATHDVVISITGTNDTPTIVGGSTTSSGSFTEADLTTGSATADTVSGSIAFADVDLNDSHSISQAVKSLVWTGGTLTTAQQTALTNAFSLGTKADSTGTGSGTQAWQFSAADSTFDFLAKDKTITATYRITLTDDSCAANASRTQDVTVTIHGANDNPVGVNDTGTAIEAGGIANSIAGSNATGNVLQNDRDVDSGSSLTVSAVRAGGTGATGNVAGTTAGTYCNLILNADGSWVYALRESDANVQALAAGTSVTDRFNYTVRDEQGATDTAVLTITVNGKNDAPVFSTGAVSISLSDTAIYNTFSDRTGTISGIDSDSAGTSFDIRGGVTNIHAGTSTHIGLYGTLTLTTSSGSWTFHPNDISINALQSGTDVAETFEFRITDTQGAYALQPLTVNITHTNDTPQLAHPLADQIYGGSGLWSFQVPAEAFTDAEGSLLVYTAQLVDAAGTLVDLDGDGQNNSAGTLPVWLSFNTTNRTFTGTPPDGVSIYLRVTATDGGTGTLAVSDIFQFSHSNRAPSGTATATLIEGTEDIAYTVSASQLLLGFSDADGDTMTVSTLTSDHGEVADHGDGTFTVTPVTNYNGLVQLTYNVTDGHGGFFTGATRSFNLAAVNDVPALTGTAATLAAGKEDTVYNVLIADLKQGFTDAENSALTVANLSAKHGTVMLNANNISYDITPEANYNGLVTLFCTVDDNQGGATTATQNFTLESVNHAPALTGTRAMLAAGTEDTPTPYTVTAANLKAGFTDADTGDTMSITGLTANHGSFGVAVNGVYTYTPETNYNGVVTLSYGIFDGTVTSNTTQTFMLAAANDAPTGTATVSLLNATEDRSYLINPDDLLPGFSDVDSNTLSVTNLTATKNIDGATAGVLVHNGDGSYTFTPETDFNGVVNLSYTVTDSFSGTPGTVFGSSSFTVNPVNDAPTVTSNNLTQTIPTYIQGAASVALGDIVVADVDANDTIMAILILDIPAAGYLYASGIDSLTHEMLLDLLAGGYLPSDLSDITSDPVTGIWTKSGTVAEVTAALAAVSFHPNTNWNTSGFTITTIIRDAAGTGPAPGVITLNVAAVNDPPPSPPNDNQAPTATNLTPTQPVTYNSSPTPSPVALGDIVVTDVDSASVTATLILNTPAAGTLTTDTYNGVISTYTGSTGIWTVTGSVADVNLALADVSFTPVANWGVDATITTMIRDASGAGPAPGTITLHGTVVNQAPSSSNDSVSVVQGMPKILSLANFGNYDDPENGNEHWVIITQLPGTGTLQSHTNGVWNDVLLSVDDTTSGAGAHSPLTGSWITVKEITSGHLRYLPVPTSSFAVFDVGDDTLANTAATFSITIGGYTVFNLNVSAAETGADLASAIASAIHAANASLSNVTVVYTAGQLTISDALAREITAPSLRNGSATELDTSITIVTGSHSVVNTSLQFRVEENPISAPYSLAIDMVGVNDAPVNTSAQLKLSAVDEDTATSISESDLLWGYTDPEGNTMHVSGLSADYGSVTPSDGGLNYTIIPEANWHGSMALTYDVIDGNGGVTPATQSYTVTPINDDPLLTTTRATLANSIEDTPVTYTVTAFDLLTGFTDADGTTPYIAGNAVTADHGTFTTVDNSTWTYHPELNYNGLIVLFYSITDGISTIPTTQTFTLAAANDAPAPGTALVDQSVNQGAAFAWTIPVGSFTDVDSAISYSVVRVANDAGDATEFAMPGWLSFNSASRTFSGTPGNGDAGDLYLKVIASDGFLDASDVVKIYVANINDAPTVAMPLENQTYTGSSTWTFSVVGIFSDADANSGYPGAGGVNPDAITYSATQENGAALPSWLTFDPGTWMFSGNPTGGTPYITIRVTGTDSFGASAFSTFTLNLTDGYGNAYAANNPGTSSIFSGVNSASVSFAEGATLTADFADVEGTTQATPTYLWQVGQYASGDITQQASYTWTDVDVLRGHAAALVLTQSEVGLRVRVQTFFTDDGGTPEAPISEMTFAIANFPDAGSVEITGILVENSVLTATVTDQDGLPGTIAYVWSSSADNATWTPITGATSSTCLTTTNEGGKYMKVVATYNDLQGGDETPSAVTAQITAGAVAPQTESVAGSATEKGGTLNDTDGSVASGQLIIGHVTDTPGDLLTIASVESGDTPGLGNTAVLSGSLFTIDGTHGTLTVHTDGSYSYAVNETDSAVQGLADFSSTIDDQFNYTVTDQTLLTDSAVLTITIHGANDAPVITAEELVGGVTEQTGTPTGNLTDSGIITFTDVDLTDVHLVSDTGTYVGSGTALGTLTAIKDSDTTTSGTGGQLTWKYTVADSVVEYLAKDQTRVESFTITLNDQNGSTLTKQIDVTITGTNDVPLVANELSALFGSVTEAGNFDNGTVASGNASKSATLIASDIDTGATQAWSLVGQPGTTYGTMSIDTVTGKWTYILDNTLAATQSLKEGQLENQSYTARVTDDKGGYVDQTIIITIKGSNDSPVAVADTNATSENVMLTVTAANGLLANDTDPDAGATHAVSAVNGVTGKVAAAITGNHGGTFTIAADGSYTFNPGSNFDYLAVGETGSTSVNYTVIDDKGATSGSTVTVTITGTNDAPVVASTDVTGAVSEATGTPTALATLTDSGTIAFSDVDLTDAHTLSAVTASTGALGTLTVTKSSDTTGTGGVITWNYSVGASAVEYLAANQTKGEAFTFTLGDSQGGTVERTVTVTLTGTNDLPAIVSASTTASGAFTETALTTGSATVHTVNGSIAFSDVDLSDTHVTTVTGTNFVRSRGTLTEKQQNALLAAFHLDATTDSTNTGSDTQAWHFSAADSIFDFLATDETLTATYSVTINDQHTGGIVTKDVVITVTGTNDAAVISGTGTASLTETNAPLTATGTLTATDIDGGNNTFVAQTNVAGTNRYGKFSIDGNGVWNYTTDSAHNEFVAGTTHTDSITVATTDGTPQVVTVSIAGTNDAPVISGIFTGSVTETTGTPAAHSTLTSSGTMEFSDFDVVDTHTPGAVTASTNALGTLAITKTADTTGTGAGGLLTWNYSVDAGAVEYLAAGETKDERFTFTLSDDKGGTTERTVSVTLTGTNDVAIVSGSTKASGTFYEASRSTGSLNPDTASSSIVFADVDLNDVHGITVTDISFVWSNGTLTQSQKDVLMAAFSLGTKVDSTGTGSGTQVWFFSAPDATFDFLAKNETLTAVYSVTFDDGHTGGKVTKDVVITVIGINDAAVISGTSTASLTETNAALTTTGTLSATDVDSATTFVAQTNVAGSNGYGTFSIGTNGVWSYTTNSAHNEFVGSINYTDSLTVSTADGTQQTITVTIAGINDAAVITGTSTASLTETKTALATTGTLSATDVDSVATFVAQTNVAGSNGYGHFSIGTNGVWNYTTNSAHGEFVAGANYTDSFTVTTADGTPKLVMVTIVGSNSGAVITGTSTASLTESDEVLTATGTFTATNADSPTNFIAQTNVAGNHGHGHFTIGANGIWSYTTDNAHNEFTSGTDYTDSFMVSTADGTEQVVTVTIAGTNDAAVISGKSTALLTQTSVPLTASGTLSVTDVDSAATFIAQTDVTGSNGYGKFSIGTDGVWSYTANSAHNEFAGGINYTDSITVSTADGTQQLVTITITGVDDPAVLSSAISTLSETSTDRSTGGTLTIRDVDTPSPAFVAQDGTHGTYGTFVLGDDGVWSYTFDPEIVITPGHTYSDLFNVFSTDGTPTTVDVYKTSGAISLGNEGGVSLVDLTVPVGITFSEKHSAESTPATLHNQLAEASGSKLGDEAFAGIDAYVLTLDQSPQQVMVRNITFSSDTTASSDPIIINGASATGEGSTVNPNHHEALVVDVTNLPSGSVITFNNIEFAIIIGAVRLTGGDGKNFVIGDSASQWIVLGAEDDTLYGGGGDDIIGSHGGNDVIFGDAGNDTLFGGIENDTLCGGSGDDVIYGDESTTGGNGVDTALYADALAGVKVNLDTKNHNGIPPGTADDGILYTTKEGDARTGHDILFDIENIVGGAFDDTIIGSDAANKLEGGAGNDTLMGGVGNDTMDGGTGTDTAVFSGKYADYTITYNAETHRHTIVDNKGSDGTDTVINVENLQFSDGHQFQGGSGNETMTGGSGIDTVTYQTANAGVTVDLSQGTATSTPGGDAGIGSDTLVSIENVAGSNYGDTLIGSSADNQLTGGKGDDTLDGGAGTDTAVFSGKYADYTITYDAVEHTCRIVDNKGSDGADTVSNIESFQFADGHQFFGSAEDETVTGGVGTTDTVSYLAAEAGITVDLSHGRATSMPGGDAGIGADTLISIENVVGGDYADQIIGSDVANRLDGGAGNDSLTGGASNDTLTGGSGNDTLDGGDGTDTAVFSGKYADYSISYNETTHTYTIKGNKGSDGTDTVHNVENFQFADGTHQDIIKPAIETFSPNSGATGVAVGSDVVLTFSESIHRGSGTIAIHSGSAGGPVVASSDDATTAVVTVSDHTVTINPVHDLAYGTHYYVTLADGSIHDLAENNFAGTTDYDFSTGAVSDSGADPYAGDSHGGSGTGVAILGLGVLGVLAWVVF